MGVSSFGFDWLCIAYFIMVGFSFERSSCLFEVVALCRPAWTGGCLNMFLFKNVLVLQPLFLFLAPI
jgi:hypothetical protein